MPPKPKWKQGGAQRTPPRSDGHPSPSPSATAAHVPARSPVLQPAAAPVQSNLEGVAQLVVSPSNTPALDDPTGLPSFSRGRSPVYTPTRGTIGNPPLMNIGRNSQDFESLTTVGNDLSPADVPPPPPDTDTRLPSARPSPLHFVPAPAMPGQQEVVDLVRQEQEEQQPEH